MREVPECLNRRYRALDELIQELSSASHKSSYNDPSAPNDPGIKLMCEFWNILKEDPNCDLPKLVQKRMCPGTPSLPSSTTPSVKSSVISHPQRFLCYMANESRNSSGASGKKSHKDNNNNPNMKTCCTSNQSSFSSNATNDIPLSKVLCNLKEAASFDKKCASRINDLLETEKRLQGQIAQLENREKQGVVLLKQADCMWSCMEDAYKEKVAESLERQRDLLKQLKEVEKSVAKWRKNKKDLESQLDSIAKAQLEINQKITRKTNDIKTLNVEIEGFKKRIDANKKATEVIKKSIGPMKKASDARIERITADMKRLEALEKQERKIKLEKEAEGAAYIKEAREDLQKICKALLQKKLEKEDLSAEKNSLLQEIDLLKTTCDMCKDKCKKKQDTLGTELNKVEAEIAAFKLKCTKCHQCTDTSDQRNFCNDCPRCAAERECLLKGGTCTTDMTEECVCQTVKQKFLDNVFENMYTVLERQIQSKPGKAIADQVLKNLRNSRNGKLNAGTRKILQEFILTTVKKNLNLTIVGGAVKTRCELDPETYKQLMLCLKQIKATPVPQADKGTDSKKDPCKRWGGGKECNCPKGPKDCVCTKRAPPAAPAKGPCPPLPVDNEDKGEVKKCPHKKDLECGVDCSMHTPDKVGADVSKWKPDPCEGPSCPYSKNMRAAQCVLGPEMIEVAKSFGTRSSSPGKRFGFQESHDSKKSGARPISPSKSPSRKDRQKEKKKSNPNLSMPPNKSPRNKSPSFLKLEEETICKCGDVPVRSCSCRKDRRTQPCQNIIDEIIGTYTDVAPIEKVTSMKEDWSTESWSTDSNIDIIPKRECTCTSKTSTQTKQNSFSKKIVSDFCTNTCMLKALREQTDEHSRTSSYERKSTEDGSRRLSILHEKDIETELELSPKLDRYLELETYIEAELLPKNIFDDIDSIFISPTTSFVETTSVTKLKSNIYTYQDDDNATSQEQQLELRDNVKNLVEKFVINNKIPSLSNIYSSSIEWVRASSLLNKITSRTDIEILNESNETLKEMEIKNSTLKESENEISLFQAAEIEELLAKNQNMKNANIKKLKRPLKQETKSVKRAESKKTPSENGVKTLPFITVQFKQKKNMPIKKTPNEKVYIPNNSRKETETQPNCKKMGTQKNIKYVENKVSLVRELRNKAFGPNKQTLNKHIQNKEKVTEEQIKNRRLPLIKQDNIEELFLANYLSSDNQRNTYLRFY